MGKRKGIPPWFWTLVVCIVIALSILVRWTGLPRRFAGGTPEIQLEVLNGTGESGAAMRTAVRLRKAGIDVLLVGDAEHFRFERSIIIDRKGDREIVSRLSDLTGCRLIVEQRQERPLVDATFVIGWDLDDLSIGD